MALVTKSQIQTVHGTSSPHGLTGYGSVTMELLNEAVHSPNGWQTFKKGVGGVGVETWVESYGDVLTGQVRLLATMPDHHSTGAIDEELARVREFMEPRAFC